MSGGVPLVRAGALSAHLDALRSIGAPCAPLLARVHLPPELEGTPNALISYFQVVDFSRVALEATGLSSFPVLVAARARTERIGGWGQALVRPLTLGGLLRTLVQTYGLHTTGARWWMEDRGSDVLLCHRYDHRLEAGAELYVPLLGYIVGWLRTALGPEWRPRAIALPVAIPWSLEALGLECPVHVSNATVVPIPRRLLLTPSPRIATEAARGGADGAADLAKTAPQGDFVGSIRQALAPLAAASDLDVGVLSEVARVPVRTLQRRLGEAGTSFRDLVGEVQFGRALALMADPGRKLIDIAYDLGFSDPAHFTRAFRRWTGVSPREFRRDRVEALQSPRPSAAAFAR